MSLPKGWSNTDFETVLLSITNGIADKQNKEKIGIPVTRIETIASERVNLEKIGFVDEFDKEKLEKYKLNMGDILFSHINSPLHLGKTAIFEQKQLLYHGTNLLRLVINPSVYDFRLFNYFCKYLRMTGEFSQKAQHAVNQSSLNQRKLKAFDILLPPLNEQKRIAQKLDEVLSTVESIKTRLDNAPTILKRFRQSILAAATSGKLTEEWRRENGIVDEWEETKIDSVLNDIRYGTSKKCSYDNEFTPVLRIPNISDDGITIDDVKYAQFNEKELENLSLQIGDILVIRSNGSLDLVGKNVVVTKAHEGYLFAGYLIRMRFDKKKVLSDYVHYVLTSPKIREVINLTAKSTSGVNNVNSKELSAFPISIPTLIEQKEIVSQVESLFALADSMEAKIEAAQKHVDKLTQSILAKAFRGELVPQDPTDEPAQKLLERIRVEQESVKGKKSRGKKG